MVALEEEWRIFCTFVSKRKKILGKEFTEQRRKGVLGIHNERHNLMNSIYLARRKCELIVNRIYQEIRLPVTVIHLSVRTSMNNLAPFVLRF